MKYKSLGFIVFTSSEVGQSAVSKVKETKESRLIMHDDILSLKVIPHDTREAT